MRSSECFSFLFFSLNFDEWTNHSPHLCWAFISKCSSAQFYTLESFICIFIILNISSFIMGTVVSMRFLYMFYQIRINISKAYIFSHRIHIKLITFILWILFLEELLYLLYNEFWFDRKLLVFLFHVFSTFWCCKQEAVSQRRVKPLSYIILAHWMTEPSSIHHAIVASHSNL